MIRGIRGATTVKENNTVEIVEKNGGISPNYDL